MPKILDIIDEARGSYLNDPSGSKYTDVVMIPKVRTAYSFLQTALESNNIQCKNAEFVKTILAGETELNLPNDLVFPTRMQERLPESDDEYRDMRLVRNINEVTPGPFLDEWAWRLDLIFVKESTADREIRLYYQKSFPAINAKDDVVFGKAEQYLAAKSAALALMFIDQSPQLAETANDVAEKELTELLNIQTKIMQAIPTRRKPYLPFRLR